MLPEDFENKLTSLRRQMEVVSTARPIEMNSFAIYESLRREYFAIIREKRASEKTMLIAPIHDWAYSWHQGHNDICLKSRQGRTWLAFDYGASNRGALLIFRNCWASRCTSISYDRLEHHLYHAHGLEGLGAYLVECSPWIADLLRDIERPVALFHYVFCFNSCLVECAAEGVEAAYDAGSVSDVWREQARPVPK